jgi:hypothetical protein
MSVWSTPLFHSAKLSRTALHLHLPLSHINHHILVYRTKQHTLTVLHFLPHTISAWLLRQLIRFLHWKCCSWSEDNSPLNAHRNNSINSLRWLLQELGKHTWLDRMGSISFSHQIRVRASVFNQQLYSPNPNIDQFNFNVGIRTSVSVMAGLGIGFRFLSLFFLWIRSKWWLI